MTEEHRVTTTAAASGKKSASTHSVIAKEGSRLVVPLRTLEGVEGIALGFQQNMLTIEEIDAGISTGAGLGTDFIKLWFGEHRAALRGSEVLCAWIASFDPKAALRFPESVRRVEQGGGDG